MKPENKISKIKKSIVEAFDWSSSQTVDPRDVEWLLDRVSKLQTALDRVLAECEVSTDRDFHQHLKSKVEKILGEKNG